MRQVSGGSQETLGRFALRPPLPSCLPFPSNTGGLLMATSIPRALLRTHACESCGILDETAIWAGQDNSGSWSLEERLFCDESCTDKPPKKLLLVRREFYFTPPPFVFVCVVLREKGNFASDTQAVIYRMALLWCWYLLDGGVECKLTSSYGGGEPLAPSCFSIVPRWRCWDAVKAKLRWQALDDCFGFVVLEWMTLRALCTSVTITGSGGACRFSFCALVTDMWHGGAWGGGTSGVRHFENRQKRPNKTLEVQLKNKTKTVDFIE